MPSNTPPIPPITAPSIPDLCQQPFPGAVSAMATTSQPRPTAIEVPPASPRPGFMFRADGVLSDDAPLVFSEWSGRVDQLINNIDTLQQSHELLRERCLLLSAACKKHDITYIVMHHIYCIWSHSKQYAYQIMLPFAPDAIDSAFAALSLLVKTNDALSPAQLDWFHRFPAQTFDSFVPSPILVRVIKDILRLLSAFAAHWPDFRARIISRSFPALVCEMRDVLQCSSYIVQNIIFHTSRRLLGCPDGYLMDVFQNSFDRDRNFESAISFNRFTPDHIQQTRQALVMNYSELIAHIRSQAHSIHLPVEITTNVKSGDNELHVSLPSLSQNEVEYDYFVGVEIVTTQKYASVWRAINTKPRSSADATRDAIKHRYRLHDTDEVALLSSTWKVSICDPISSKMCDTPVRGIDCKHFECFDLENWLQTRPLKPGASQTEPCLVDCWACPICGDDARPNQLRICDYFSDVVKQLREAGNSEMRTIVI
ncbi:hypothetical protein NHJ13051_004080, partial [Beauveria bassiana]